jgi:exosortase A-associated hydrolase 2
MTPLRQEAFQLPVGGGQRLCVWRAPKTRELRARIVNVHPFAEEMNKSRSNVASAARALARAGFGVLEIDLCGCGDSTGDFGDATLDTWVEDVCAAVNWSEGVSNAPLWLWGVRAGALVAGAVTDRVPGIEGLLLWQPVLSGQMHLTQFLRLKVAADALARGPASVGTKGLRERLRLGESVEVAGYRLSASLATALDRAEFHCATTVQSIVWLEVGQASEPAMAPASTEAIDKLRNVGIKVVAHVVGGAPFWQTVEIEHVPSLVTATVKIMSDETAHALA